MTTYNTGNPVPSADARDRYDNSQTLDEVVNGGSESYTSRTGKQVISLGGMNSRFNNAQDARESAFNLSQEEKQEAFQSFLDGTGWSSLGAYGAGVVITSHTQTIDYQGQPYQLKPSIPASLDAPYITTGAWATEGVNFKLVGDNSLRQDLADPAVGGRIQAFQQPGSGAAVRDTFSKLKEIISVDDFKLATDPDDSAAFMRVIAYVATKSRPDPYGVFSNLLNGYKIVLQPRDYLITTPSALSLPFSGRSVGVVFEGNGFARVFYQPTSPAPLFVNADKVLFLRVRGIIFTGASADSDFFDSQSTGGAQDYTFSDCYFNGVWRYGVNRTGTNTNSETRYNSCNWTGTWKAWEFIAATGTSDQFVNYWFNQCKYWSGSVWVDYSKGGHIRIISCDISGYRPAQLPEGEGPGGNRTQYLINLRGNTHGFGVCSLAVLGGRIEQGSEWAGLLNCEWGQGDVTFESFDSSSQTFNAFAPNIKSVYFSPGNNFGPAIKFSQSQLIGTHTFVSQATTVGSKRAVYENSTFTTVDYPDDAFTFVDAGSQAGRRCVVRLKNCRGRSATLGVFADADLNWNVTNVGHTSQKGVSLKSPTGTLPSFAQGVVQVVLPVGCVVVKVIIHVPSGASTSGNTASFTVQNGSGEVLATLNLTPISAGGTARVDLASICSTRERSTISLVPSALMNASIGAGAFCVVEYL